MIIRKQLALVRELLDKHIDEAQIIKSLVSAGNAKDGQEVQYLLTILKNPPAKLPTMDGVAMIIEFVKLDGSKTNVFTYQGTSFVEKAAHALLPYPPGRGLKEDSGSKPGQQRIAKFWVIKYPEKMLPYLIRIFTAQGFTEGAVREAWDNYVANDYGIVSDAQAMNEYFYDDYYHFSSARHFVQLIFVAIALIAGVLLILKFVYAR